MSWLRRASRIERPIVPFVGIALLAFAATELQTAGTDWGLVAAAAAAAAVVALIGLALPWSRFPPAALLLLPVACDGVIALLRHAQGGSTSGYSPLAILPVLWVGLTRGRRAVAAISACTSLMFALPIVAVGPPMYPATGWRGVVLWTIVAAVVGTGANRVVADQRRQAALARRRAAELDGLVATQNAIATTKLDLDKVLTTVVEEALALTAADGAVVELPDGDEMVYQAASGIAAAHVGLRLRIDRSLSGRCLEARQILICDDTEKDTRVDRDACRRVGARSLIVIPLLHDGEAPGVLKVYSAQVGAFGEPHARLLALLANMIGAALVHADLMQKLSEQAVVDELTGLPNRRAWYQRLELALERARRSGQPLSVLILDLDGFKQVNDRGGHAAGDRLLKGVGSSWSSALRKTDVLGRVGGDEFAVILESADELAALEVIKRLDRSLTGPRSASAGLAVWDGAEDAATLVSRADADMYEQKRARARTG